MKTRWICMLARGPHIEVRLLNITTNGYANLEIEEWSRDGLAHNITILIVKLSSLQYIVTPTM
jgi:hypothetical protein